MQDPAVDFGGGVIEGPQTGERWDGAVIAGVGAHGDLGEMHKSIVDVLADALHRKRRRSHDGSSSRHGQGQGKESMCDHFYVVALRFNDPQMSPGVYNQPQYGQRRLTRGRNDEQRVSVSSDQGLVSDNFHTIRN